MKTIVKEYEGFSTSKFVPGFDGNESVDRGKITPEMCEKLRAMVDAFPESRCVMEILLGMKATEEILA